MAQDLTPPDAGTGKPTRAQRRAARQAKKAEQQQTQAANASTDDSESGGIVGWLRDSYNGLFKIVIQPHLPKGRTLLVMVLAFLFGMIWAYSIAPTQFYDGAPSQMNPVDRDNWIRLVAGSYSAGLYDEQTTLNLLSRVENPVQRVNSLVEEEQGQVQAALRQVQAILPANPNELPGTPAPSRGNFIGSILTFVIAVIVFVIVANAIAAVWGLLIGGYVERFLARFRPETDADRAAKARMDQIRRNKELEDRMKEQAATSAASTYGPPITQKVSTYMRGRQFDDSFAIENAADQFLGECGATVAKTLGDTGELAAVEVWLFDKDDFVRTLTKLFVTEHVYNDPVARSELDTRVENPQTDIIVAQPGAMAVLETGQIRMEATVADMAYGAGPPPNSYFDALTIQVQAWEKAAGAAPAAPPTPVAAPGAPTPAYSPPPQQSPAFPQQQPTQPTYSPPPPQQPPAYPPPQQPGYNPPPAPPSQPPRRSPGDDDPFGGTGDFTPIGGS